MLGQGSPTNVSLLVFWGRAQGQPAVAIWACGKLRDRIPRGPGQVPPLNVGTVVSHWLGYTSSEDFLSPTFTPRAGEKEEKMRKGRKRHFRVMFWSEKQS